MADLISDRTRTILTALIIVVVALVASGCSDDSADTESSSTSADTTAAEASGGGNGTASGPCTEINTSPQQFKAEPKMTLKPTDTPTAMLKTSKGTITVTLLPKQGLHAANNFVFLAREGFYDCVPFHRIIKDFMIQTGDPTGTGAGGPGYTITDDKVTTPYQRGTLAMANTGQPNSGGSQFFIVHGATVDEILTDTYPIFGKVTAGMDVLDEIASVPVESSDSGEPSVPTDTVWLESVKIAG